MPAFARRFPVAALGEYRDRGGIAELFKRWVLPGEDAGAHGLRLAIRNGYLNFYVKGQSVAELRFARGEPRLKMHCKYHEGIKKADKPMPAVGQAYVTLQGDDLRSVGEREVFKWIETAETYAGDEKRFVDDLIAVTPGVIDLEMALPAADSGETEDRVAPRMDLVVAQGADIAFWEAKLAANGELRSVTSYAEDDKGKHKHGPHVIWQLLRYQRWIARGGRVDEVRRAYVAAASDLADLALLFGKSGDAAVCWKKLAEAGGAANVIMPPGIVVAGYCPLRADGVPREKELEALRLRLKSFAKHKELLTSHGITVSIIPDDGGRAILPSLVSGTISAELAT